MRRLTVAALAVAALGLAGCGSTGSAANHSSTSLPAASSTGTTGSTGTTTGSGSSGTPGTSSTSGSSATTGSSGTSGSSATGGSSATTGSSAPGGQCATSQLSASLTNPSGAAGSVYYHLVLTNKGSSTCFVAGYPGVSFVTTPDGSPIGAPAERRANPNGASAQKVTLASGASAYSVLQIVDAGNFPSSSCGMTKVPGIRIYPPNQKTSLYVTSQQEACSDSSTVVMNVEPFRAAG